MARHPTIAVSNRMFPDVADLIAYCRDSGCSAVDYSFPQEALSPKDIAGDHTPLRRLSGEGFRLRFHTPFFHREIASADPDKAEAAVRLHQACIDLAAGLGGAFLTAHIGLGMRSIGDLDFAAAAANLSDLVEYGAAKGLTVCLENLTKGFTAEPGRFLELLETTGAGATFDLGHANACPWVTDGRGSSLVFLGQVAGHVRNAHVYEIERIDPATGLAYHVAPENLETIGPLLAGLSTTVCDWWLIELRDQREVDVSLGLLRGFLAKGAVRSGEGLD